MRVPGEPAATSRLALRVRVRLHRSRLDRQLADGLAVEAFVDRALRASQLADPVTRCRTARTLRRLVREALLGLADRLEDPTPVNPCGVARALVLLSDGGGPLYNRCSQRAMGDAVWWVADGLQGSSAGD